MREQSGINLAHEVERLKIDFSDYYTMGLAVMIKFLSTGLVLIAFIPMVGLGEDL